MVLLMNYSKERGEKISKALKGKAKSKEHSRKVSESMKGNIPWNKGKSRFSSEEEKLNYKREYNRLRSARIRTEKKLAQDT